MKLIYILLVALPLFFSCTSSYKTLQTPDDVYYSPAFYRSYNVKDSSGTVYHNSPAVIVSGREIRYYDDIYYYRRNRDYYENYYLKSPSAVYVAPRMNILTPATNSNLTNNPKITGIAAKPVVTTKNHTGQPVRIFKHTGSGFVGSVLRTIATGSGSAAVNSNHLSGNQSGKSSGNSTKTSAPVRTIR